jgi:hypothetical protein
MVQTSLHVVTTTLTSRWYIPHCTWSQPTFEYQSLHGIKICIPAYRKSVACVRSQVTACFTSASAPHRLPPRRLSIGPNSCKTLGHTLPAALVTHCGRWRNAHRAFGLLNKHSCYLTCAMQNDSQIKRVTRGLIQPAIRLLQREDTVEGTVCTVHS